MQVKINKKPCDLPDGATVKEAAEKLHLTAPEQAVAAEVNGTLRDLDSQLNDGDDLTFYAFDDPQGKEVFWHTSAHVLAQAVLRLWPDAQPTIGPPIEQGFYYDFANLTISDQDFKKIEEEVAKILSENHKTERKEFKGKEDAKKAFPENPYKCELIDSFDDASISAYSQGEFVDLCRGPHLPTLSKIKAFKVLKTSGAYWRADAKNAMLTRIYGISFPDRKRLKDYLYLVEEAKKRDHKVVGPALDLFSFKEEAPGMPFIHARGLIVWNHLIAFLRDLQKEDYIEIKTPTMMSKELWEKSGHWFHYKENMYISEVEEREFAVKPMNCPGCMLFYKGTTHSYRELPLRIAEIGHVHRFESSGSLNGLFRVRSFHQDDAHVFMRPDQIREEILGLIQFADKLYMSFGLPYRLGLSTRPEKKEETIGSDEDWDIATAGLKGALDDWGHSYRVNEGDGAFYGPKIDIEIRDALGRFWQCGTIQLDFALPQKFDLEYVENDGSHQRPIMLHRAILGSIERFFGVLIEHFNGKFPLWMSPYPVRILTVADRHVPFAKEVIKRIKKAGFSCDLDDSNESVGKKVRNAQLLKTNYMLTIGDKEETNKTIALRTRDNVVHGEIDIDDFLSKIVDERETKSLMSAFATKA